MKWNEMNEICVECPNYMLWIPQLSLVSALVHSWKINNQWMKAALEPLLKTDFKVGTFIGCKSQNFLKIKWICSVQNEIVSWREYDWLVGRTGANCWCYV